MSLRLQAFSPLWRGTRTASSSSLTTIAAGTGQASISVSVLYSVHCSSYLVFWHTRIDNLVQASHHLPSAGPAPSFCSFACSRCSLFQIFWGCRFASSILPCTHLFLCFCLAHSTFACLLGIDRKTITRSNHSLALSFLPSLLRIFNQVNY